MVDIFFRILSFVIAVFLTFFIVAALAYSLKPDSKKIQIKSKELDVYIVEANGIKKSPKKSAAIKKSPKRVRRKKRVVRQYSKKRGSRSMKSRKVTRPNPKDIRHLFSNIDPKKFTKSNPGRTGSAPSRKKGLGAAQELVKSMQLQDLVLEDAHKAIKSVEGEVDPYLEKVYKILYENWVPSSLSAGNWAKVKIVIDIDGSVSYKVIQWGQSTLFNEELKSYLEYISTLLFPLPKRKRVFTVKIEAK
jgi:protein TonB